MKLINKILILAILTIFVSCSKKENRGRFNYPMIKSKISLTEEQASNFDEITKEYTQQAKQAWIDNADKTIARSTQKIIFAEQDAKIKEILNNEQYEIYFKEVNIERTGREKHNMTLIKEALQLDSLQAIKYDLVNTAFFTTLSDNHDNYHGKPEVYKTYFKEIDVSRKEALKKILTNEQYNNYLKLAEKYQLGKIED
ncbi:hypothetical protein Fleli_3822 [Bernardetia litoralis DSM 6794]|uniref:Lipoprotein n=1 Tax=Bernardetia litoralis (strain ATCC 23117 / DSM 6794 / NBRC 15988 / NCIMB 1366 / Fx l1 / Sio-4) TaxID=880071 RepID=I4AQ93_BERLS|nr:hypothetical protein [Bernardetia litoralis]AFM06128.1 hypothetical protein Fleli_3822 [Bernardetia litoralis DSM 6794]